MKMSLTLLRTNTKFNIKAQDSEARKVFEKVNNEASI